MRESCGLLQRPGNVILDVSGAEGAEFLQGQLTNDVEALEPGGGCYAALLDRKGRMRAELRVLRFADDLITVETDAATAPEVQKHLSMYKVGREVEVGAREGVATLALIGPAAVHALGGAPLGSEHSHRQLRLAETDVEVISTDLGAELWVPAERVESVRAELHKAGAEPVDEQAAEIIRVESGRPRYGAEMGPETIPQEAGINERAVNFDKGCYIGQETVARLHYKGKPNRHLRRLRSSEPLAAGEPVSLGDKKLGSIGSGVISPAEGPLALAILRREAEPGAEVTVGSGKTALVEEIPA